MGMKTKYTKKTSYISNQKAKLVRDYEIHHDLDIVANHLNDLAK